ncbi:hypothetical protein NDA10_003039 [Ustilago hordei]|nr:hypothetical protein NDA10_003039 [Ustilago hordei]UTT92716.1 hypothetical protein NDA17_001661 [Ustilago hordei]
MPSRAPSIGARCCLCIRSQRSARLSWQSSCVPARRTLVTAAPTTTSLLCNGVTPCAREGFHTASTHRQAVEVANSTQSSHSPTALEAESIPDIARRAQSIADPNQRILTAEWTNRVELLNRKAQNFGAISEGDRVSTRIVLVGSSLSQTQQLLTAMVDEPLREISEGRSNEAEAIVSALASLPPSTPFTIKYNPGPFQLLSNNTAALDRHWLQQSNLEITVLLDPTASAESTYDLIYDSEAVIFVTDDYALSQSARRPHNADERGNTIYELLSRFAAKPHIYLAVNSILGLDRLQILDGLESATGASVADLVAPHLVPVRISDALAANSALRQALDKQEPQTPSHSNLSPTSTGYWDEFSGHYQRSNVGSLIQLVQNLRAKQESKTLVVQSAAFLLQHCLEEALATVKRNLACLYELRSFASQAKEREQTTLKQSLERIWPPSTAYTGQLSRDEIKIWRPALPGSQSAVDEAMQQTDDLIESTFDTKLQWWKLIWKADDVRKELESACAGFAASLESDLAYESGRLATLQVEKVRTAKQHLVQFCRLAHQLGPNIASASRDVALLTNEAEAYRSTKLRTIEPSTLMEPIHRRRAQLLETGGPIDVLASKSRKLAVTSSAAVAVTAAGVGSASVLGASLGLDASSASLALDPSTGLGLGLLTLTLVGWRMQGQFGKLRRQFRKDWQRFSEGLDQDLKNNFETVLRQQINGPSDLVSSRILSLTRVWGNNVQRQENLVRSVAAQTPHHVDTTNKVNAEAKARESL